MVRHKTRFLLARLSYDESVESKSFPSKKELSKLLKDNLIQAFGISAAGAALDTHGACVQK
jgi:hypothetical protein